MTPELKTLAIKLACTIWAIYAILCTRTSLIEWVDRAKSKFNLAVNIGKWTLFYLVFVLLPVAIVVIAVKLCLWILGFVL